MEEYLNNLSKHTGMDDKMLAQKKALLHKLALLHQLVVHGYEDTAKHWDDADIKFLNQIRNLDFYTLKLNIERELYSLSA